MMKTKLIKIIFATAILFNSAISFSQFRAREINWTNDGKGVIEISEGNVVRNEIGTNRSEILVTKAQLTPAGKSPLEFNVFSFSPDEKKMIIYTNSAKVWRYKTRGDYWVFDLNSKKLYQLGKSLPSQSLMFAKISPDGKKAAYVSEHNVYVEDLATNKITQLTKDGTRKLINGTFDWAYEEEFDCRDGFRWSPDSRSIAFWQVDATTIRDYFMLNTTDSVYSRVIPVEYPKVGQPPSAVRIGVINVLNNKITWMKIPGDPQQHYLPRMEWAANNTELVVQQLNRKQNESKLFYCNAVTGIANNFYTENNKAWIDIKSRWNDDGPQGWEWINGGKEFLWVTEKDGWQHIYKVSRDGKKETLLTQGNYDIATISSIDEANNSLYFMASPDNATELYLYRVSLSGTENAQRLSQPNLKGTHEYNIAPNAKYAVHSFSNYNTIPATEWVSLPDHKSLNSGAAIENTMRIDPKKKVEYFTITTEDNITVDGWLTRPADFDSTKKYPVVFYVYGEPANTTTANGYGRHSATLYKGNINNDGYFYVSLDNRGTPALKGAEWRKSIYKNLGRLNIRDYAMAAKKLLEKPYFDKDRVAVWGWSGGGSSTLNFMFQYPEIFKTGISIAAVDNLLFYDNIYEERYMGLPQEDESPYIKGSPVYYAKNLAGKLLIVHGTGDDNVHYSNAEALLNELIKHNKQFQFMPYPNRTHNISEGPGTREHLKTLFTEFLRNNCPPGAR